MQQISRLLALAATLSTASAGAIQGFNYGAMATDDSAMFQADFETSFKTAQNLVGTDGAFTSARLYTMIQAYSTSDVIQAIPAAIATNTTLLLGLWASGTGFENEITALKAAIAAYGSELGDIVTGISVGSEDLYRNSATSIANGGDIGQEPSVLAGYITEVRNAISGTALSTAPVGHVDTWDAWSNTTNQVVIDAVDWFGVDEYPYWQYTDGNAVENGASLFQTAYDVVTKIAGDKEVWVTETGWAVSGKAEGEAVAGTDAAKTYWDDVGCNMLFGKINTYWYTLTETGASPDFGVSTSDSSTTPLYDLSCSNVTKATSSSSSASSTATGTSSGSSTSGNSTSGSSGSGSSGSSGSGSASGTASSGFSLPTSGAGSNTTVVGSNATVPTAATSSKTAGSTSSSSSSAGAASSSVTTANGAGANAASIGGVLAAVALAAFAL